MDTATWTRVLWMSLVGVAFWLAGFGAGYGERNAWVGWLFLIFLVGVVVFSIFALIGSALLIN